MASILIVEDETPINKLINKNLTLVGHKCISVFNGEDALEAIENEQIDLVLLDIMLPKIDGFGVIEKIEEIPVIFLTAKSSLNDKLKGLTGGADDYIVKPFEMLELIARIDIVLKRTKKNESHLDVGNVHVNFESKQVFLNDELVDCTPKEFDLLETLIINRNIALSREKLLNLVWDFDYVGDTRTVDVHIQRLRKKLNLENYIKTVYKTGYRLEVS